MFIFLSPEKYLFYWNFSNCFQGDIEFIQWLNIAVAAQYYCFKNFYEQLYTSESKNTATNSELFFFKSLKLRKEEDRDILNQPISKEKYWMLSHACNQEDPRDWTATQPNFIKKIPTLDWPINGHISIYHWQGCVTSNSARGPDLTDFQAR